MSNWKNTMVDRYLYREIEETKDKTQTTIITWARNEIQIPETDLKHGGS